MQATCSVKKQFKLPLIFFKKKIIKLKGKKKKNEKKGCKRSNAPLLF
jgi:hypothetical protein